MSEVERKTVPAATARFARVPASAVVDKRLSPKTFRELAMICVYANKDGLCWPATQTMADRLRLSRTGVRYHIKKLEDLGLVYVERRSRARGARQTNRYQIVFHEF